jgi:hypothetical protein
MKAYGEWMYKSTFSWPRHYFFIVSGVGLSPLGTVATTGLLYQPQMIDEDDCGEISGIKIGRGNRNTRRKTAPAPLCSPQIPHDQTRAQTRAAAVGSQRLTTWAMARPTSALAGGEWLTSRPCRFTPGKEPPRTHWIGGSVDLRAGLDDMEKWTFLSPPALELRPEIYKEILVDKLLKIGV